MKLLKHIYLLCPLLSTVFAANEACFARDKCVSSPSKAVRLMPAVIWRNIGDFLAPSDKKSLVEAQKVFEKQFQREVRSAKEWADSLGAAVDLLKYILSSAAFNNQDKRYLEVLGIWDSSEDRAAMAVRLVVDPMLFNPPTPIDLFGVSSDPFIESFLRQMYQLRDQLSTPSGNKIGYELYRAALHHHYPQTASAILYIIKSAAAQSAIDISEELHRKLESEEIHTLNEDIISTFVGRIINAVDFKQLDFWLITGSIEALNSKGFTRQAERLYSASQEEACQARKQVKFSIAGIAE